MAWAVARGLGSQGESVSGGDVDAGAVAGDVDHGLLHLDVEELRHPVRPSAAPRLGDFDQDGAVAIHEIIRAIRGLLEGGASQTPRFVNHGDGTITDHH